MKLINKEEKRFLFNKKISEGKDPLTSDFEIARDEAFQYNLKTDFKTLQQEILRLRKENIKLEQRLAKLSVPIVSESNLNYDPDEKPTRHCSVNHLLRVLHYLEESGPSTLSQIRSGCMLSCRQCVDFLVKYKLIHAIRKKGDYIVYYVEAKQEEAI